MRHRLPPHRDQTRALELLNHESMTVKRMHYLLVEKPDDHKYMMEWVDAYNDLERIEFEDEAGRHNIYEWINDVPLNGQSGEERIVYRNSWVTDIAVTTENIKTLVRAGRCRWKSENELFNVMKNSGYYMKRNYGHDQKNLSFNFYLLILLVFISSNCRAH